jgi:hypothetical protein
MHIDAQKKKKVTIEIDTESQKSKCLILNKIKHSKL